jgi:hypothetical protein
MLIGKEAYVGSINLTYFRRTEQLMPLQSDEAGASQGEKSMLFAQTAKMIPRKPVQNIYA